MLICFANYWMGRSRKGFIIKELQISKKTFDEMVMEGLMMNIGNNIGIMDLEGQGDTVSMYVYKMRWDYSIEEYRKNEGFFQRFLTKTLGEGELRANYSLWVTTNILELIAAEAASIQVQQRALSDEAVKLKATDNSGNQVNMFALRMQISMVSLKLVEQRKKQLKLQNYHNELLQLTNCIKRSGTW